MITENGNDAFFAAIRLRKKHLYLEQNSNRQIHFIIRANLQLYVPTYETFSTNYTKYSFTEISKKKKKICNDVRYSGSNRDISSTI